MRMPQPKIWWLSLNRSHQEGTCRMEGQGCKFASLTLHPTSSFLMAAIERQPPNFWLWHAHSTLCAREHNLDGAIEACQKAFERSPNNPAPIMELMNLHAAKGEYMKAVDYGVKLSWFVKPRALQAVLS